MSEQAFDGYSKYYDLLYRDKNYVLEADYVYKTLTSFQPGIKTILELGMGTGIHASLLQNRGMEITGIELSESMAEKARQKGLECHNANCSDFNLGKHFDAVISLFHVISYLTLNEDLLDTLRNVHKHLNGEGLFLFDIWYSPAVYNLKPETRIKRLEDNGTTVTRIAESVIHWNKNTIDVNYEIFIESNSQVTKITEKHPMRHFSLPELALFARMTGFELIRSEEWLSEATPSEMTWGVACIFKKII